MSTRKRWFRLKSEGKIAGKKKENYTNHLWTGRGEKSKRRGQKKGEEGVIFFVRYTWRTIQDGKFLRGKRGFRKV